MSKLYFKYGTISSGKTLDLLKVVYNYEENNLKTVLLTSQIDDRYGNNIIKSRTGISKDAISIDEKINIYNIINDINNFDKISCVLVDEVQFFTKEHIYQLSDIVDILNIPVICYGLRNDFRLKPFEASSYLMMIADEIEEIKTICSYCGTKKATINGKFLNDKLIIEGEQIEIGGNEKYKPLCRKCYNNLKL
jgi:thymidine kinase